MQTALPAQLGRAFLLSHGFGAGRGRAAMGEKGKWEASSGEKRSPTPGSASASRLESLRRKAKEPPSPPLEPAPPGAPLGSFGRVQGSTARRRRGRGGGRAGRGWPEPRRGALVRPTVG